MAFTQSHLDEIDAAILKLSTGSMVQEIEYLGKRIRYTPASLTQLMAYRSVVANQVEMSSTTGGPWNKVSFNDPT